MNPTVRRVVVNADDLGLSEGVNRGIFQAHERGILTSASLMVRQKGQVHAVAYCRANPRLGVGLHLDLGEWRLRGSEWVPSYEVVPLHDSSAVEDELARQLAIFEDVMGRKPTHLDSHQHVHRREPVRSIMERAARARGIPLRGCGHVYSCGEFYGQSDDGVSAEWMVSSENLIRILCGLPQGDNEMSCHPGFTDDVDSAYATERSLEIRALCDPSVREMVRMEKIKLVTFAEMQR